MSEQERGRVGGMLAGERDRAKASAAMRVRERGIDSHTGCVLI